MELSDKESKHGELVSSMDQTLSDHASLKKDVEEKKENMKDLESDVHLARLSLEKRCQEIENLKEEMSKNCAISNEQTKSFEAKIMMLEKDVLDKEIVVKEITDKVSSKEKEVGQLNEQCNALRDNFNKLCVVKDESAVTLKSNSDQIETLEKENMEKENEIIEMGEKLQDVFSENDALKKNKAKSEITLEESQNERDSLKTGQDKLEEELKEKEKLLSTLDGKLGSIMSQLEEMEVKEKTMKEQLEVSSQEKLNFEEVEFYLQ